MTARFPASWEQLVQLLSKSNYLQKLCHRTNEQALKNGKVFHTVKGLKEFYASNASYVTSTEKQVISTSVQNLYKAYPSLPKSTLYFVVINSKSTIEFGHTSFTVSNVIFLDSHVVFNKEVVMHEVVHVLQRQHAAWFKVVCTKLGFNRWNSKVTLPRSLILNPDAEAVYADKHQSTVVYSTSLKPTLLNLKTGDYHPVVGYMSLLGADVDTNSITEMFAVRLTKHKFISRPALRQKVNDILNRLAE